MVSIVIQFSCGQILIESALHSLAQAKHWGPESHGNLLNDSFSWGLNHSIMQILTLGYHYLDVLRSHNMINFMIMLITN